MLARSIFGSRTFPLVMAPDGSVAADPQGFDRAAFLDRFAQESIVFFDKNLR